MTGLDFALLGLSGVAAGAANALAGGGTFISFPTLTAMGIPVVAARVTSAVALCPGYLGAAFAQARDLRGQGGRLWTVLPAGVIGGVIGGVLLLLTGDRVFRAIVPYLILGASVLLATQEPIRRWLIHRTEKAGAASRSAWWVGLPIGLASVYGGYFGAGLSVIVLAVLAVVMDDTLTRLNALKQSVSFSVNISAAIYFLFSGQVVWSSALVMAVGAVVGGILGGRLAGWVKPATLRWMVVVIGVVVSAVYLVR